MIESLQRESRCGKARAPCETLPIFLSDVKARRDKMVELVERVLKLHGTANGLRLTACGPDEGETRVVEACHHVRACYSTVMVE
ncbi:MAG: hypothetical protein NTX53_14985 [candidate division WOR-3 bacterium]|nr:hypothetical protein [candidate division WOR-3 bacterium]